MGWRLVHHFHGSPCREGRANQQLLARRGATSALLNRLRRARSPEPTCPADLGRGLGSLLAEDITVLLSERGIDYDPGPGNNAWLWCLGGPDLLRHNPSPDEDFCIDLHLEVCDLHEAISVRIDQFDLVPQHGGGTGPDDPYRAEPVELSGSDEAVRLDILARSSDWLDEVLVLPREA